MNSGALLTLGLGGFGNVYLLPTLGLRTGVTTPLLCFFTRGSSKSPLFTVGTAAGVTADLSSWYGEQIVNYVNLPGFTTAEVEAMALRARLYADAGYTAPVATGTVTVLTAPPAGAPASATGAWIQVTWPSASTQQPPGTYWHSLADTGSDTGFQDGQWVIRPPRAT